MVLGVRLAGITLLAAIPLKAVQSEFLSPLPRLRESSIIDLVEVWLLLESSDKRRDNLFQLIHAFPPPVALELSAGQLAIERCAPVLPDMKVTHTQDVFRIHAILHRVEKMASVKETVRFQFK